MISDDKKDFMEEYERNKLPQEFLDKYESIECLSQAMKHNSRLLPVVRS